MEYAGVALWLAITRYPAELAQQQRVIAGFLLGRAGHVGAGGWHDRYPGTGALLQAVNAVLAEHLAARLEMPGRAAAPASA